MSGRTYLTHVGEPARFGKPQWLSSQGLSLVILHVHFARCALCRLRKQCLRRVDAHSLRARACVRVRVRVRVCVWFIGVVLRVGELLDESSV